MKALLPLLVVAMATASVATPAPPVVSEGFLAGADGARIFYRKVGNGAQTVVYLHGGPGSNPAAFVKGAEEFLAEQR